MRNTMLLLAILAAAAVLLASCSPGYILRAGWEEARILAARQPIDAALEDRSLDAGLRDKLDLVRQVRAFSERRLGLDAGESYRSFTKVDRDTLVMVLSAAPEFELRWKTWWFPIVGRLPYKGFFDPGAAAREAERLGAEGYDTYLRPSSAFSTLGWLPDPVLSTALRGDPVSIAQTVIHEITHTTFFPKGEARFNESFANFVGHVGAIEYFCGGLEDEAACGLARDRWHDTRAFARFFRSIHEPLEALYAGDAPAVERRADKRRILTGAAERFRDDVAPGLRSGRYADLDPDRIDNAWLLSRLLYYSRLDDFDALYRCHGGLEETIRVVVEGTGTDDPWATLDRLLAAAGEDARIPSRT